MASQFMKVAQEEDPMIQDTTEDNFEDAELNLIYDTFEASDSKAIFLLLNQTLIQVFAMKRCLEIHFQR